MKKIFILLGQNLKYKSLLILLAIIFGSFLEVFGMLYLYQIMNLIIDGIPESDSFFLIAFYEFLDLSNDINIKVFYGFVLILIFLIRNCYLITLVYYQNLFGYSLMKKLQLEITTFYVGNNQNNLNLDSSNKLKNILTEIPLCVSYILSNIYIFTEILMGCAILISLFIIDFYSTLIICVIFFICGSLIYFMIKWKSFEWSILRERLDLEIFSKTSEVLSGRVEINLYDKLENFLSIIDKLLSQKKKLMAKSATLGQLPKYALELIAVIGIMFFLFLKIIKQSEDLTNVLSVSGILTIGIFKILPSINKILQNYNTLKFNSKSFGIISEIKTRNLDNKKLKTPILGFKNQIVIKNLSFNYNQQSIFNDTSFKIIKNKKIGIFGGSGEGKSTLIKILLNEISPSYAKIEVDKNEFNFNDVDIKNLIAFLPQQEFILSGSIKDNITLKNPKNIHLSKTISKILSKDLISKIDSEIIKENGSNLSGGQKQRISIARSIFMEREILIFDEPTNSLSKENKESLIEFLKSTTKTMLIISHDKMMIDMCDIKYELKEKKFFKV